MNRIAGMLVALSLAVAGEALAGEPAGTANRYGHVSAYWAQWVDSRLPAFPVNAVTGNLRFRDASMVGLAAARVLAEDVTIPLPWLGDWRGHRIELEGQVIRHSGFQRHYELAAALVWRTPDMALFGGSSVNLAWGNGLSYALSDPAYEFGVGGLRGVDTRRFQYHMLFEAEFRHVSWRHVSVFARLHHRSGIYGLISPQRTGSNFVGAGLRWSLY